MRLILCHLLISTSWLITSSCHAADFEPDWSRLVPAIVAVESSGDPHAYNARSGAVGLMQITPIVLQEWNQHEEHPDFPLNIGDLYRPDTNVHIGTWYLHRLWSHYLPHYGLDQSLENLLYAYNFGISNLRQYRAGTLRLPTETREYVEKVTAVMRQQLRRP